MANIENPVPDNSASQSPEEVGASARQELANKYAAKTSAEIISAQEFEIAKEQRGIHVVGVIGFSGQWGQSKIDSDPLIKANVEAASLALEEKLLELKDKHGDSLIVSSGATMEGVPKIIYDLCEKHGIVAMGVACEKAFNYPLGKMKFLIVEGQDWGAESETFLKTSNEILMLGGGGQAKREAIAAVTSGKEVTVFCGYGGSADQLNPADMAGARFVKR
jgi:hypothetical protein